jgi:hypothetical protein
MDVRIVPGWCRYCDEEHGWTAAIVARLAIEFPGVVFDYQHPLPSNHPYIQRMLALEAPHMEQLTIDLSYDDSDLHICATHLRAIADLIDSSTRST